MRCGLDPGGGDCVFGGAKAVQDVSHRHFAHRGSHRPASEDKWGRPGLRGAGDKDSQFRNAKEN